MKKTYSKIVQERLEDDWIVDDEGLGYADDGREIFDDHDGDVESSPSRKRPRQSAPKKQVNPDIRASPHAPKLHASGTKDIRNMFATSSSQNFKPHTGKTGNSKVEDAALDDLLAEIVGGNTTRRSSAPPASIGMAHSEQKKSKRITSAITTSPTKPLTRKEVRKNPFSLKKSVRREDGHPNDADSKYLERAPFSQSSAKRTTLTPSNASDRVTKISRNLSTSSSQPKPEPVDLTNEPKRSSVTQVLEKENKMVTDELSSILEDDQYSDSEPSTVTATAADIAAPWMAEEGEVADEGNGPSTLDYIEEKDNERLNFFWFDAYEDSKNQPGVIFLFGKVRSKDDPCGFVSCCIRVKDLERRLFFLPRPSTPEQEFTVKEVYQELRELTGRWKIEKFKCKPTVKKYAFELADVPSEAEYLEVRYPAAFPALPADLSGNTFSRVFGANTSFLENLILDLRLRGPCWLELTGAVPLQPQLSWCKVDYDFSYQKPNTIMKLSDAIRARTTAADDTCLPSLPQPPPLRLVALDIKSVVRRETNSSEIISVGLLIDNHCYLDQPAGSKTFQSHYLVLSPPKGSVLPYDLSKKLPSWGVQYQPPKSVTATGDTTNSAFSGGVDIEPNERALLGRLLTRIHRLDPDLIVGHDLWGHQLDLLLHRLNAHKVPHWHRISRLRRSAGYSMIFSRGWFMRNAMPGRLICDSRVSAKELIRSRTYNLSELAHQVLPPTQQQKRQIPPSVRAQFSQSVVVSDGGGISQEFLSGVDLEVDSADLRCLFASSAHVKDLIDFCLSDALLVLRLVHQMQALPLANQITTICGNVLSRTLAGGRSERNEALLLHAFNDQGYLVPDPPCYAGAGVGGKRGGSHHDRDTIAQETLTEGEEYVAAAGAGGRRKPAYTGGLVLEPKKGFYDSYILLLDFNSLYPSIIQEFNLCFTTMDRSFLTATSTDDATQSNDSQDLISALIASVTSGGGSNGTGANGDQQSRLPTSRALGILPMELRRLVDSRREVKKLIAAAGDSDPVRCAQWNIRQMALKITANSVYGCLGFAASRFCARGLAALVTGLGRALLINTRDVVENMNYEVIYGDTDSIMVNTNSKDLLNALSIGEKVKHEVNRRFRLVELDTDGVFAAMLLLAKKKYAALSIVNPLAYAEKLRARQPSQEPNVRTAALPPPPPPTKAELKGLDIVRRDWCRLAAGVGRACVDALLSGKPSEEVLDQIHAHLRTVTEQVRQGTLPLPEFVITKMLTKNPEDYPDAKLQPHVQVALRFNQATNLGGAAATSSSRRFRAGDTVEYIICEDGTNRSAIQRAYSPAEMSGEFRLAKQEAESEKHNLQPVNLKVDVQYYLAHQIHPVVSRLVAPIEGTSPAHIADCLGLDPTAYRRTMASAGEEGLNEVENYDDGGSFFSGAFISEADPLSISCPRQKETGCTGVAELRMSPFSQAGLATWACPGCGENLLKNQSQACGVVNKLVLQARRHIIDYETGWLVCEDPACGLTTRNLACPPVNTGTSTTDDSDEETRRIPGTGTSGLWTAAGKPLCPACGGQSMLRQRYSEAQLYRQLIFFRHLLEPTARTASEVPVNLPNAVMEVLQNGLKHVYRLLAHSAFAMVDLGHIFAGLRMRTTPGAR
uniref:DNA polymerase n=1 Tax=Schistocephalus solidus TaxID=70667 RepID=A0A0V0J224_SCHSO